MMDSAEYLHVGRLVGPHGIRGEVRVLLHTDFPEFRFAPGKKLWLIHPNLSHPLPLTIEKCRPHRSALLVKFAQWDHINQVEPYKDSQLVVDKSELAPVAMEKGEFYYHQIVGCAVITTDGERLGFVREILSLPANDVWVVRARAEEKELLIPYISDVVKEVDVENRQIRIQWMEGLN
jgi:16S rRNA processing protein RimM